MHIVRLLFDPPSSYIVPLAFVVALASFVYAPPSLFGALRAICDAASSFVVALPLKYVVVVVHCL